MCRSSCTLRGANIAHALDAGFRLCFIRASFARASDAHRSAELPDHRGSARLDYVPTAMKRELVGSSGNA